MTNPDSAPTKWWIYIEKGLESVGITQSRLADELGIARPTLSRWRTQGVIPNDADTVRHVAQILHTPIADALCALGYLDEHEAAQVRGNPDLSDYSNDQLLDEIARRMVKD